MSCDVGEVTESLENELFTYVTVHSDSPSFPSLHLCRSSFSNLSVTSPTSQLILQPFHRSTYVKAYSPTLPLLHLRHSSFSNLSFVSPTSQDFHLRHMSSHPCKGWIKSDGNSYHSVYKQVRVLVVLVSSSCLCKKQFLPSYAILQQKEATK